MIREQIKSKSMALIAAVAFAIIGTAMMFTDATYAIEPPVTVSGLTADDYTVAYSNNTKIGKATVTIEGRTDRNFKGKIVKTFSITKRSNAVKAKVSKKTFKAKTLKKKTQSFKLTSAVKVSSKKGKISYTVKAANAKSKKALKYKSGKVTVEKATKKGTYKLKVTIKDAGTKIYKPAKKTITLTVVVK